MKKLILLIALVIPSVTFSVSATEGQSQGSGVLGPEVQCTLQDGSVIKTFAQICTARKGSAVMMVY